MAKYYLAIDLGATSGRHILSHKENGSFVLEEIHRFKTGMEESPDGLVWNVKAIFDEIVEGIRKALLKCNTIESLSIDSWGVDYVLIDKSGNEIWPAYAYRNDRLLTSYQAVHKIIPFEELYKLTGIQFASFNTIYQLYDDLNKGRLDNAEDYLTIAEYFIYKLTGIKTHEYTAESTTGLLDAYSKNYNFDIIDRLGLPRRLFKPISQPGTYVATLLDDIKEKVGGDIKVVLCPSHDTASAFEAVECDNDSVIISSGTWSLLGVKSKEPITDQKAFASNFTNEGGVGYIRFLKNIMGMWIVNEISRQKSINIPEICKTLDDVEYSEIFDVNDSALNSPKNMEEAVVNLLNIKPKNDKELFASVFHSLAYCYKKEIDNLEFITGKNYRYVYIVGGGAKNKFLNSLVEKYTKKEVKALPIEATAIGNLKIQMN